MLAMGVIKINKKLNNKIGTQTIKVQKPYYSF